jgi:hypothetical protein
VYCPSESILATAFEMDGFSATHKILIREPCLSEILLKGALIGTCCGSYKVFRGYMAIELCEWQLN